MKHLLLIIGFLSSFLVAEARQQFGSIHNDVFWDDADGNPLYSQGGGIFKFHDPISGEEKYYWYGVKYKGAEQYRLDPSITIDNAEFSGVTCYSSSNLTDWHYEGDVLTPEEIKAHGNYSWIGRLGVAYLPEIKNYVLVVQCDNGVLFATSPFPAGSFKWQWRKIMTDMIGTPNTGDQTVFFDHDTGKSYLVYSYGKGRNRIYISEIGFDGSKIDLLDCHQIFVGESREGNCMFKRKGKYYMCASNIYGWDGSFAYYLVSDNIYGPYTPVNDMQVMPGCEKDYAHVSQTGFFYTILNDDQEMVIFCGDRWADFAGNGLGYNQWVPLSFDSEGTPWFNSLSSWSLDSDSGQWMVNGDNNYVLNGSFEADRRLVPNAVKPRQDYLHGWTTEVIRGNKIEVGDSLSPVINFLNSREDRLKVIGEKSLRIADSQEFERRVSQSVESSPFVALPKGEYELKAKVRNGGRFTLLDMYAECGNKTYTTPLPASDDWTEIKMCVPYDGGCLKIGFHAIGEGGAECLVDDVELVLKPEKAKNI